MRPTDGFLPTSTYTILNLAGGADTLAQYQPQTFEMLAYELTVDKLVTKFGYPEVSDTPFSYYCNCTTYRINKLNVHMQILQEFKFDWRYMSRGLTIDKKQGNILKIDRHKYVKLAFHGFSPLSREDRLATYNNSQV